MEAVSWLPFCVPYCFQRVARYQTFQAARRPLGIRMLLMMDVLMLLVMDIPIIPPPASPVTRPVCRLPYQERWNYPNM